MVYLYMVTIILAVVLCTVFSYKDGYKAGADEGFEKGYNEGCDNTSYYYEMIKGYGTESNVKPVQLSPDDQSDVDEKGDVFREWYNEELDTLDARDREYINVKGQAGVDIYNAEKER